MPDGIFQKIAALPNVELPWEENNALLDIDYIYRWSGYKSISPLVRHLLGTNAVFDSTAYTTLAGIIWANFGTAWTKKYEALVSEYDPLKNYDMTEHEDNEIVDDALTNVSGLAANNTTSANSTKSVYAYNSSTATPSESESASTGTNTNMDTNYDNTRTIDRTLTRSGNIGVTTSQQMLESELKLRAYRFFEEVYKDVDRMTALPIYDGEIAYSVYNNIGVSVTSVNGKTGDVELYGSDIDLTSLISTSVASAIANLDNDKRNKPVVINTTLLAGQTTKSVTDSAIGDTATINVYYGSSDGSMTSWSQSGTTFIMNFDAMDHDMNITLEVYANG